MGKVIAFRRPIVMFDDKGDPIRPETQVRELPARTPELVLISAMMHVLDQALGAKCPYDGTKMRFTAAVQHVLREIDESRAAGEEGRLARLFANAIADRHIRRGI